MVRIRLGQAVRVSVQVDGRATDAEYGPGLVRVPPEVAALLAECGHVGGDAADTDGKA